jgi:hypothetical protein
MVSRPGSLSKEAFPQASVSPPRRWSPPAPGHLFEPLARGQRVLKASASGDAGATGRVS